MDDDGGLGFARNGIGPWTGESLAGLRSKLGVDWLLEALCLECRVHTSQVGDDGSVTAAAAAVESGVGVVDSVRHLGQEREVC